MNKENYFFSSLKAGLWKDCQWIITLLSYAKFDEEPSPTPFTLKYEDDRALYYIDGKYNQIEGSYSNIGLFSYNSPIDLPPNILENAPQGVKDTTIGRILLNKILLCHPFQGKIAFINKRFGIFDIESIIKEKLQDTPKGEQKRDPKLFYIDEYITFCDSALFLTQLTQVCVPALTEKALTPPEGVEEYKKELMNQHKGDLSDPQVVAAIQEKLVDYDLNWMKGDRSLGFLINKKKDFQIVRKKLFLGVGQADNFDSKPLPFNPKPLWEGVDYQRFDDYINEARIGSFARGAETQLGGVAVKELLRVSSNLKVAQEDCNSTLGVDVRITPDNYKTYLGSFYIDGNSSTMIEESNVSSLFDKTIHLRSPAFCKVEGTGFCAKCCGPKLSLHTHGLSAAVSAMGSVFLYSFMKSMHGKVAKTTKLDIDLLLT